MNDKKNDLKCLVCSSQEHNDDTKWAVIYGNALDVNDVIKIARFYDIIKE